MAGVFEKLLPASSYTPSVCTYDIFSKSGDACCAKLDEDATIDVFESDESETEVTLSWSNDAENNLRYSSYTDFRSLEHQLDTINGSRLKVISVSSLFSFGKLCISKQSMQALLRRFNVSSDFASVILSFSEPPRISEQGYECFARNIQTDGSYALSYLYRFVERSDPSLRTGEWKFRQIGVYSAYSRSTDSYLYIFLQPHRGSQFDCKMQACRSRTDSTRTLLADPFRVHEILISTYSNNWRWYLHDIADKFQSDSDAVFTASIRPTTIATTILPKLSSPLSSASSTLHINFDKLQSWRDLSDRITPLTALLESTLRTNDALYKIAVESRGTGETEDGNGGNGRDDFFEVHRSLLLGFISSAKVLEQRVKGVIDLLADTLNLRNQQDSADLNQLLFNLTQDTVDDSATVRVITFVTLIYLPASFISSIFGMNLFVFNQLTNTVRVSTEFWIYVATFVPLTLLTLALWWLLNRRTKRSRERRQRASFLSSSSEEEEEPPPPPPPPPMAMHLPIR